MRRFSFEGKLTFLVAILVTAATVLAFALGRLVDTWKVGVPLALAIVLPLTLWVMHRYMRPVNALLRALGDAVTSLRDGDFSFGVVRTRDDELGDLVALYNEVSGVLREERRSLFQRELLLDTVIQSSPVALLLLGPTDAVVYSNTAARHLLLAGKRLEGLHLEELLQAAPERFRRAMMDGVDGLFSTGEPDGQQQVYHVSTSQFVLHARPHRLFLIKKLTRELNRQEVATWKKIIRVITHELNNSLAPIASLAHSGRLVSTGEESKRLDLIFSTIEERSDHLKQFVESYSRFAKLPDPLPERVRWRPFVAGLRRTMPFVIEGVLPETDGFFDPVQMEQVLINLLKNAAEAGAAEDEIAVSISASRTIQRLRVADRGSGMSEAVLQSALLPFYSTKRSGTGLGLALCREIVEAHDGDLSLQNRDGGGLQVEIRLPGEMASKG